MRDEESSRASSSHSQHGFRKLHLHPSGKNQEGGTPEGTPRKIEPLTDLFICLELELSEVDESRHDVEDGLGRASFEAHGLYTGFVVDKAPDQRKAKSDGGKNTRQHE